MSILNESRNRFVEAIAAALGVPAADVEGQVKPADPKHADFSFQTARLAKVRNVAPPALAQEVVGKISAAGLKVVAAGPYVNASILPMPFVGDALAAVRAQGDRYGNSDSGAGKTVVIDYSSPNIAKPIAFHHIRSTVIGHCLANLYRSQGWTVQGINYLGDWGKQFGLVAVGFQEYGEEARKGEMAHLVEVYVKANSRAEAEPAFDEKAREFFRKMEAGDEVALGLWKQFRETSINDFKKIYARLGINFEHYEGESRYQGKMDAVIEEIKRTVGVKESDGALIVDLPYGENEPPVLLKKNDGSTLYATRDLAAAHDRYERFKFDRALYVVAADQSLHFKQFFGVLEKMGRPWRANMEHIKFGRVKGMSTRKGNLKLLNEVLDEAHSRALERVQANIADGSITTEDPDALAEAIGLGAIIFGDLKNLRTTDYEFDWDKILALTGDTGPYLQYAHARTASILAKAGGAPAQFDAALLTLPEELALTKEIARLPVVIEEARKKEEPSLLARYLLDLAAAFSRYFTLGNHEREHRVLVEDNAPLRAARLGLTDAVRASLKSGLSLLGIAAPERM